MASTTSVVGKTTAVPPSDLNLFHRNPRQGDVPAIMASLRRHSQYAPITVNVGTHTGRPNEVLKGNHTTLAFRELAEVEPDDPRWRKILVFWVDVDDDMAERIVVADNRTGQLGGFDTKELVALIEGFGEDIDGLGYTDTDIDDLRRLFESEGIPDTDGDGEGGERGTGDKLALWGSTTGEPDVQPERGSIWQMGHHTVAVLSVHLDWESWGPLLEEGSIFAPYPSLLLPYGDKAKTTPMVMVQPDPFIAGWLLTKWNRLNPDTPATQVVEK